MHWRFLTSKAANFETLIGPGVAKIDDYMTTDPADTSLPPNGYGPNHAYRLAQLPSLNKKYPSGLARKNADNYMWMALTMFWREQCSGMELEPSTINDDRYPDCTQPQLDPGNP